MCLQPWLFYCTASRFQVGLHIIFHEIGILTIIEGGLFRDWKVDVTAGLFEFVTMFWHLFTRPPLSSNCWAHIHSARFILISCRLHLCSTISVSTKEMGNYLENDCVPALLFFSWPFREFVFSVKMHLDKRVFIQQQRLFSLMPKQCCLLEVYYKNVVCKCLSTKSIGKLH